MAQLHISEFIPTQVPIGDVIVILGQKALDYCASFLHHFQDFSQILVSQDTGVVGWKNMSRIGVRTKADQKQLQDIYQTQGLQFHDVEDPMFFLPRDLFPTGLDPEIYLKINSQLLLPRRLAVFQCNVNSKYVRPLIEHARPVNKLTRILLDTTRIPVWLPSKSPWLFLGKGIDEKDLKKLWKRFLLDNQFSSLKTFQDMFEQVIQQGKVLVVKTSPLEHKPLTPKQPKKSPKRAQKQPKRRRKLSSDNEDWFMSDSEISDMDLNTQDQEIKHCDVQAVFVWTPVFRLQK